MTRTTLRPSPQGGFTLVELIVTIAILAVLAGVLVPGVNNYIDKGKTGAAISEMRGIANVYNQYRADTGSWPHPKDAQSIKTETYDLKGMACFFKNTREAAGWDGPYFNEGVMTDDGMLLATYTKGVGEGLLDSQDEPFKVYAFADGWKGTSGGLVLVSDGPDGRVNTPITSIFEGKAKGDDLVQIISYKVN